MSTGRSEAHPPHKVKHDRRSNGRIILFMSASFALEIESQSAVRRKACKLCEEKQPWSRRTWRIGKIIADNLSKAGWSWGCVSAVDSEGRTIFVADAHRDDGKRFVVRAEKCWLHCW
jgi:hypothetical protein